jgi:hypothetical protein
MKPEMSEFSYGYAYASELVFSLGSSLCSVQAIPDTNLGESSRC